MARPDHSLAPSPSIERATGAVNNLIKRIGFRFRQFRNYRTRVLLYAARPDWDLLATIAPRLKSDEPDDADQRPGCCLSRMLQESV